MGAGQVQRPGKFKVTDLVRDRSGGSVLSLEGGGRTSKCWETELETTLSMTLAFQREMELVMKTFSL